MRDSPMSASILLVIVNERDCFSGFWLNESTIEYST